MTEETLEIRLASTDDLDEIMKLAFMACQDNSFLDYSAERLLQEIWPALNLDKGLFAVIGPPKGAIQGFVLLRIGTLFHSTKECLEEKCLWVHPDFRAARGGRARKLLEFTKKTADTLSLPLIIGILTTKRAEGKVKLYQRLFGDPAGAFFLYGAECGNHKMESV